MKTIKRYSIVIILLCLIICSTEAEAQKNRHSKNYLKEYPHNEKSKLYIENKYGNITINNWEKESIKIEVEIYVETPNKQKAEELLEYLNVRFSKSNEEIKAITEIDSRFSRSGGSWFNFGKDPKKFSIDYTIFMPAKTNVAIINKYGDVHADILSGHNEIDVKYGNLRINSLTRGNVKPLNQITLGYSNGTIEGCNWLKLNCKYSNLSINKGVALVFLSKYSKFSIDESSSVVIESKYDTYKIDNLTNFIATTAYTNLKFGSIGKVFDITSRYSDVKVDYIPVSFEKISINTNYGGVSIGIDPDASYILKGEAKYAKIHFPDDPSISKITGNTSFEVDGVVGSDKNTGANVKVNTRYANVKLMR